MERFSWLRAGVVAVAIVTSGIYVSVASREEPWPRSLTEGIGQQAFGFVFAAACYLALVRTLVGSILVGATLGGLCWWWAGGIAEIGPESGLVLLFAFFVSAMPVVVMAAIEAGVRGLARWRRRGGPASDPR